MMITSIEIENFRGIKYAKYSFPLNQRVVCIIGAGDSGKSSLLTAIEWSLWPAWNLNVADTDFYCGKTENPISISTTISEIPEILLNEEKYGLYLRSAESVAKGIENDEPTDGDIHAITVRLLVDSSLEPRWEVITNRTQPKGISSKDRQQLSVGVVGFDYEKDFLWGRNSILQKYVNSKDVLRDAYKHAIRNAVETVELLELDQTAEEIKNTGMKYGVSFNGEIHNKIIMQNGSFSNTVGVFDGEVPFIQRGLGSKRLLSMGMNINIAEGSSTLLIDEVETGLEPYRICGLITEFRRTHTKCGQVIMTTHSQNVIAECSIEELAVLNTFNGESVLIALNSNNGEVNNVVQSIMRTDPAAFLCKKVILCEGKTEIGFLRAIDAYLMEMERPRFSYCGVGIALAGGGNKMFTFAKLLNKCGYSVSILMDSDDMKYERKKEIARKERVDVFDWDEGHSIENQAFSEAPIIVINELLDLAVRNKGLQHVCEKLKGLGDGDTIKITNKNIIITEKADREIIKQIGEIAKECEWYKSISVGIAFGKILLSQYDSLPKKSKLRVVVDDIIEWVTCSG